MERRALLGVVAALAGSRAAADGSNKLTITDGSVWKTAPGGTCSVHGELPGVETLHIVNESGDRRKYCLRCIGDALDAAGCRLQE